MILIVFPGVSLDVVLICPLLRIILFTDVHYSQPACSSLLYPLFFWPYNNCIKWQGSQDRHCNHSLK